MAGALVPIGEADRVRKIVVTGCQFVAPQIDFAHPKAVLSVPELNEFPKHHARFIEASIIRDYGNTRWIRFAQQFHSKAFVKSNRVQI